MLLRTVFGLLLVATTGCLYAVAQAARLLPTDVYVIPSEFRRPLQLPARCDVSQNFYLRAYESGNPLSPVLKVTPKVEKLTWFMLPAEAALKHSSIQDFAVAANGNLYELVQSGNDVYIAQFSSDGKYQSKTRLEREFWATHMVALVDETTFLVVGSELPPKGDGPPPKMITALFNGSGKLVRDLMLPNDPAEMKAKHDTGEKSTDYLNDKAVLPLVMGDVASDGRGNLYVFRASAPATVYVLDSSGNVSRRLTIRPPEEGMTAGLMQVSSTGLAMIFERLGNGGQIEKQTMVVVDPTTGEAVRSYPMSEDLGSAFACYGEGTFGFITTQNGKLAIQHAKPE